MPFCTRLDELPYVNTQQTPHQALLQETDGELQKMGYPTDPQVLKGWLLDWFAEKCFRKKRAKPLSTKHLADKRACVLRILGDRLRPHDRDYLINQCNRFIKEYTYENDCRVGHAPAIPWSQMHQLARALWCDVGIKAGNRPHTIPTRKRAATLIYLTCCTGIRWGSAILLRWEDFQFVRNREGLWLHGRLRVSKTNISAEVHQQITLKALPAEKKWRCAIWALARYWQYMGRPNTGLMFHRNHRRLKGHSECRMMRLKAASLGWAIPPQKNTGRVTMASTLSMLNASEMQIDLFLHWRSNQMRKHYANSHIAQSKNAGASIMHQAELTNLDEVQSCLL